MKKLLTIRSLVLITCIIQISVFKIWGKTDHWETLFYPFQQSQYLIASQEPDTSWKRNDFAVGSEWLQGICAIGTSNYFGTCNECIKINANSSLYVRTTFSIIDSAEISDLLLYIDYMDGFVAYLNGNEILRVGMGNKGSKTSYNQEADSLRIPDYYYEQESHTGFKIDNDLVKKYLKNGENLFALEVHNKVSAGDLFGFYMYLYAGMNKPGLTYLENSFNGIPFPMEMDSTPLPIVLLDVPGNAVPDDPRVTAKMRIIDNGPGKMNHLTDTVYTYNGKISIERRGSSSQYEAKHSYGFSTIDELGNDTSVELMGYPKEHDWILKGEIQDKTLLRDVLSYNLARKLGHYASRTNFLELYINGVNMGLFNLMEKIKRDTFRVDIAKLTNTDNAGRDVTGGYLLKLDKNTGTGGLGFYSYYTYLKADQGRPYFLYDYPKSDEITQEQKTYIQRFMSDFEGTLRSADYKDTVKGYRKFISTKSFIDFMILQEVARNIDGYRLSTFMYKKKDKEGKKGLLHMGPIWDFNLAYDNSGGLCGGNWKTTGWGYDYNNDCPGDYWYIPFWYDRLLQDPSFRDEFKARWDSLRKGPLQTESLMNYIDTLQKKMEPGRIRNFKIWSNLFIIQTWPGNQKANSYEGELDYMKSFIKDRLAWLDQNIPEVHEEVIYPGLGNLYNEIKIGQVRLYPNPFDNQVNIEFALSDLSDIRVSVYNVTGQKIALIENSNVEPGINTITWNGTDASGSVVKSGVYLYTLEMNNNIVVRGKIVKK